MIAFNGVQHKERKLSRDLMLMLGLNEAIDKLAMANSVCWYGNVLRREDGHVLRMALVLEVEGRRKEAEEDMEVADLGKKYRGLFE